MLKTHQLSLKRDQQAILTNLSVSFDPGKLTVLLGPNGAGKSTLLNCLSGEQAQTLDQVSLDGRFLERFSSLDLAKRRAMMPQSIRLDFPFRVDEVVEMSLIHHAPATVRAHQVKEALAWFDMAELAQRNYLTLSGGEQQRVQLARVFAQIGFQSESFSRFLLLDECTAHLDLAHQHQVLKLIKDWVDQRGIGAIMVLHDLNLAAQYADELLLMNHGQVVCQGFVEQVLTKERIEEVYQIKVSLHQHNQGWPMVVPN